MRASPKHIAFVTSALIAVSGCSSGQDWWKLSRKSQTGFSNLASAPAAVEQPALPSAAATTASGSGSNISQTGYGTASGTSGTAGRTGRYPEGPAGTTAANARGLDKYSGLEKSGGTQAPPFTGARGGYPPASTASAAATDYNNAVTGGGRYGTATATPDSAYSLPAARTADARNDYNRTPAADPYSLPANPPASYGASNNAALPSDTAASDGYRAEPGRGATDRYGRYGQDSGSSDRYAQDEPSYDVARRPAGNPVGTASYNTTASDAAASAPPAGGYRPGSTRANPPSYSDTGASDAGAAYPNSQPATAGYSSGSTLPSAGGRYESTAGGAAYSRSSPPVVAKQPTTSGDGLNSSARGSVIDPDYRGDTNSRYPATSSPASGYPSSYPGSGAAAGATSGGYPATSSPASGYPATSGYPSTSNYPTTGGYPATNNGYNGPSSNATLTR